jgi:branched-chain amino acid transport system permease protein
MLGLLLFLLLLALPLIGLDIFMLSLFAIANVYVIFSMGWDLLVGRTGQMSLGHALFYGSGAYVSALLFRYYGFPIWVTIPIGVAAGFGIALLIGLPTLRLRGPYLALITLAFPLVLSSVINYFKDVTGGDFGIRGLPTFFPGLNYFDRLTANYYLTLALMAASFIIIYKIANSRTGMVFISILDDELASEASGTNVTKYKLLAFAISGLFAALAGCINAHTLRGVDPSALGLTISVLPLIVTILGGLGTIYGPVVGTYFYILLDQYILKRVIEMDKWTFFGIGWTYVKYLVFILIVIVFILKWPKGIAKAFVDKLEDLQEARPVEEVEKKTVKES